MPGKRRPRRPRAINPMSYTLFVFAVAGLEPSEFTIHPEHGPLVSPSAAEKLARYDLRWEAEAQATRDRMTSPARPHPDAPRFTLGAEDAPQATAEGEPV